MEKLEKKYRSLRVVAWFFKFGAWISFLCGFVLFFAVLFGGDVLFHFMEESPAYTQYMDLGRTFGALITLAGFLFNALFLYAVSNIIYLFIDIEANTRRIIKLLDKPTLTSDTQGKNDIETVSS